MARAQIIIKGMDFEVFACNIAKQIPKKRKLNKRKPNWWENFRHYIWKYWIESSLHFIFAIVLAPQSKGQDLVSVVFAMPSWLQTSMTWWWYCGLVEFKGNSLTRKIHFESDAPGVHRGREAEDDEKQETFENDIGNPAYTRCCRYFRCMRFKVGKYDGDVCCQNDVAKYCITVWGVSRLVNGVNCMMCGFRWVNVTFAAYES